MNLKNTIKELSKLISTRKDDYNLHHANKLIDPTTSSKRYWSILKTLYNGRKIPIIFSLLLNDKLETDFRKKAHHFNVFSACTPLINNSVLPDLVNHNSTARLSSVNVNIVDILKIIKSLNVNKAHALDNIFIRMIKLCGQSIVNSKIVLIMAFFLIFGKNPKLFLFRKKVTNRSLIVKDLFLFYRFVEKFSKNYYSTHYLNFLIIIIFSVLISQDSDYQVPVNTNFFQWSIIFMHYLTVVLLLRFRGVFLVISKAFDQV